MSDRIMIVGLWIALLSLGIAQYSWNRIMVRLVNAIWDHVKIVSESTDTLNERLDAHWTYMQALNTRLDTHAGLIELANDKVDDWSDRVLDSLENIRDMLPDGEEASGDAIHTP